MVPIDYSVSLIVTSRLGATRSAGPCGVLGWVLRFPPPLWRLFGGSAALVALLLGIRRRPALGALIVSALARFPGFNGQIENRFHSRG